MRHRLRSLALLVTVIVIDTALLRILTTTTDAGVLIDRLLSLTGGFAAASLLSRIWPPGAGHRHPPGFWPLVAVGLALGYGIFAALSSRTPQVQPLVHLAVSWFGVLLFGTFGFWRIRRFRSGD